MKHPHTPNATLSVNNSVNTGAVSGATSRANSTVSTSATGGKFLPTGVIAAISAFVGFLVGIIVMYHYFSKVVNSCHAEALAQKNEINLLKANENE